MFLVMHYNNRSKAKTPEADKKRSKIKPTKKPEGCCHLSGISFFDFVDTPKFSQFFLSLFAEATSA